jgi:hypothetical protein
MFNKLLHAMFALGVVPWLSTPLSAAILYESGTLGPTGVTWDDLLAETVGGTNIRSVVFTGVRFELHQPVVTTQIGGHFLQRPGSDPDGNGSFFGAIVALEDESDFPNSGDLSTSDVLGSTVLTFPNPSAEVFGNLSLSLDPGYYALVFGSGLFGATAEGTAIRNNPDIGAPTYIGWQPGAGWFNLTGISTIFADHRFVVLGNVVPEPSTAILVLLIFGPLLTRKPGNR